MKRVVESMAVSRPKCKIKKIKEVYFEIKALFSYADARVHETYKQTMESRESEEWHKAMEVEMKVIRENKVWSLVDSKNVDGNSEIDNRWVYSVKIKSNFKVYGARLVARGYFLEDD